MKAWIDECDGVLLVERFRPPRIAVPVAVEIVWDGLYAGCWDADNRVKPALDYLQRVDVIVNDKQVSTTESLT